MKAYRVETERGIVLRETSTVVHAIKHGCFAAELRISVRIIDQSSNELVIAIKAIDKAHAIKAKCKRDKKYARKAKGNRS